MQDNSTFSTGFFHFYGDERIFLWFCYLDLFQIGEKTGKFFTYNNFIYSLFFIVPCSSWITKMNSKDYKTLIEKNHTFNC